MLRFIKLNTTLEESKMFSFSKTWCIRWNGKRSTSSHLMFDTLPQLIIGVFLIASQTQLIMNRRSINVMDGWMVQKLMCCLFVSILFALQIYLAYNGLCSPRPRGILLGKCHKTYSMKNKHELETPPCWVRIMKSYENQSKQKDDMIYRLA